MRSSLRIRLTIIFIGLAIGPVLLVGVILAQRSFVTEADQALDLQRQVAQRVSSELDAFLQEVENDLNVLVSEMRNLEHPDRAQQLSLLLGAFTSRQYRNAYEEFTLLDNQGREQLRLTREEIVSEGQLGNRSEAAEFIQPQITGQTYFSSVWFDEETGEAFMTIAIPYSEPRSVELKGVLLTDIRFKTVENIISGIQVGAEQTIYMIDSEGRVIAHQDTLTQLQNPQFELSESEGSQIGLEGTNVVLATDKIRLGEQELTVVAEQPSSEALKSAIDAVYTIITIVIAALLIAGILGFFVVRQIVRPIEAMSNTAQAISAGDLSQQVDVTSRDELGTLANAFNRMTAQLRELVEVLEQQVEARTQRLETVATLGSYLTTILDVDQLLVELVSQVKERFEYYHVHIYIFDEARQDLIMTAGYGEPGAKMKEEGHHIPLNAPTSLVARAARMGEIVRVDNVRESPNWLPNPLLLDTYSEMAVPIVVEGQVVGVLDVQQDKIAGLDEGDANLLRSLANQVAVAIGNARLFEDVQTKLAEANAIQQKYVRESWQEILTSRQDVGQIKFSLGESTTLSDKAIAQARNTALTSKEPAVVALNDQAQEEVADKSDAAVSTVDSKYALVAPILLRNVTIGNLQFHDIDPTRKWTDGELALIEAIIDQVAQTAENLRLLADAQERAGREQLIGQIGDKLRRSPDIETLMQTAVNELSKVLTPARTFVEFAPGATPDSADSKENGEGAESTQPDQEVETDAISENGGNQYRGYGDNINGQT